MTNEQVNTPVKRYEPIGLGVMWEDGTDAKVDFDEGVQFILASDYDRLASEVTRLRAAPSPVVMPEALREVYEFLNGSAPMDGAWYGEKPTKESAPFWWRKKLQKAVEPLLRSLSSPAPVEAIQLAKDAIEEVENWSGYASEYFQQKHDLTGTLEGLRTRLSRLEREAKGE